MNNPPSRALPHRCRRGLLYRRSDARSWRHFNHMRSTSKAITLIMKPTLDKSLFQVTIPQSLSPLPRPPTSPAASLKSSQSHGRNSNQTQLKSQNHHRLKNLSQVLPQNPPRPPVQPAANRRDPALPVNITGAAAFLLPLARFSQKRTTIQNLELFLDETGVTSGDGEASEAAGAAGAEDCAGDHLNTVKALQLIEEVGAGFGVKTYKGVKFQLKYNNVGVFRVSVSVTHQVDKNLSQKGFFFRWRRQCWLDKRQLRCRALRCSGEEFEIIVRLFT